MMFIGVFHSYVNVKKKNNNTCFLWLSDVSFFGQLVDIDWISGLYFFDIAIIDLMIGFVTLYHYYLRDNDIYINMWRAGQTTRHRR